MLHTYLHTHTNIYRIIACDGPRNNINFHNGCQLKAFGFNHRFTFISYIIRFALSWMYLYTCIYIAANIWPMLHLSELQPRERELWINLSISYLVRVRFNLTYQRCGSHFCVRTNTNSNTHIAWPKYFSWNVQIYRWLTITSSEHTQKSDNNSNNETRCC